MFNAHNLPWPMDYNDALEIMEPKSETENKKNISVRGMSEHSHNLIECKSDSGSVASEHSYVSK